MRKLLGVLVIGLFCIVQLFAFPVQATKVDGEQWFELTASGNFSVKSGAALSLKIKITNDQRVNTPEFVKSLQAVIIDPFSGTRVAGPKTFAVNKSIPRGESTDVSISFSITETENIPVVNKTLAVIIAAVDEENAVRGTTGWGFVVLPQTD
jgi:hypothetical protein